jgi:hypothetical protein
MYSIQHCFSCRLSDSTVSEDAGTIPGLLRLWYWQSDALTARPDLIHSGLDLIHTRLVLIYTSVLRRLFFAAPQRIAITLSPNYYQKMQRSTTRKNQEEHGPDVM